MTPHSGAPCAFLAMLVLTLATGASAQAQTQAKAGGSEAPATFPFVLPWDDASPSVTNVSAWLDKPAGKLGPVIVKDGHLYTGSKRLRLVGVNLCFGANFPTHDDAAKVAGRMAKFGINAVRFHHMDMQAAPNGILASDGKTIDAGQLEKLDYLFARLKENGIYADLNLHVSRTYPGRPSWPGMPSFHKGVDNFDREMIALQRDYARQLLTHVNPYTNMRYADDPAVAVVEINNENALTHEWWSGGLDDMPDPYSYELKTRWNAWLKVRYSPDRSHPGSKPDTALRHAWGSKSEPLGSELLRNGRFAGGTTGWDLQRVENADAKAQVAVRGGPQGQPSLRIDIGRPAKEAWHVQLYQPGLSLKADSPYTLTFRARADRPRKVSINTMQAHEPWRLLWTTDVPLTEQWQSFRYVAQTADSDPNARVTFTGLGASGGRVEFADVSFRPGGVIGLESGEAIGAIPWFRKRDFARRTPEAQRDWVRFLAETESVYWNGMAQYLQDELKVRAPVVGTQMGWSPPSVQAQVDVIDSHAYWQHPHFPGRSWDMDDWTVGNVPMAGRPNGGTLPDLALSRVAGKPFLCTEYNHSAPNDYGAETLPLIFAFAAMQDWDGVFIFAYSHRRDDWDTGKITSFFDIDQHPAKMATLPASSAMFLRGDVATPGASAALTVAAPSESATMDVVRRSGPGVKADAFGLSRALALRVPVAQAVDAGQDGSAAPGQDAIGRLEKLQTAWSWRSEGGRGTVTVNAARSKAVITSAAPGKVKLGDVVIATGPNPKGFAVITATALEGSDFHSPGRILVTAAGTAENTGMAWKDASRTSVGRDWGQRPSRVEGVAATLTFPVPAARVKAWALDDRGHRRDALKVSGTDGQAELTIGPEHRTLWYEIEVRQ
jgi:hypothetical protein